MKKIIITIAVIIFTAATLASAAPTPTQSEDSSTSRTTGTEKSSSRKESEEHSKEKGGSKTKQNQKGWKKSWNKSASKALENARTDSLNSEIAITSLFYEILAAEYPDRYALKINDFLYNKPYSDDGRVVDYTSLEFLQKSAAARSSAKGLINLNRVRLMMTDYVKTGLWIRKNTDNLKLAKGWGYKDWKELVELIVIEKSVEIGEEEMIYNINGDCTFVGDFSIIQCGPCLLDLSMKTSRPELRCNGMDIFTSNGAGGVQLKVTASTSSSIRDAQTMTESDEQFRAFSETLDEYVRWGVKNGLAVEATAAKKAAIQSAVNGSSKIDQVAKAMEDKQKPAGILGILGIK